ncbi:MAG: chorismate synthase [Acholeplasmatales bacterium]
MNAFGKKFIVEVYGESHGESIGVIIDGVKSEIKVNYDLINADLERRRPNKVGETKRVESDLYTIESGVYDGFTTGTPILVRIPNINVRPKDYRFKDTPRPSHTDYVSMVKYGRTYPGSGHFSGRITAGLVVAGSFAKMMFPYKIETEFVQVGNKKDKEDLDSYIEKVSKEGNSVGAILKVTVKGVPAGLGEPFFDSVESVISAILYSVPSVKGVSFGVGFSGVSLLGSEYNDPIINEQGKTKTNNSGGINGGITNGNDLIINVFMRPASSISIPQEVYNFKTKKIENLEIKGRHDAFFQRRAVVVVENAIMIALADLSLRV